MFQVDAIASADEDDDTEDGGQLVIDEGLDQPADNNVKVEDEEETVSVKESVVSPSRGGKRGGRGRGRGRKGGRSYSSRSRQDSSSIQEDTTFSAPDDLPEKMESDAIKDAEVKEEADIKIEKVDHECEDDDSTKRTTRSRSVKKKAAAPKSKTWFPGGRTSSDSAVRSPTPPPLARLKSPGGEAEVLLPKKEPKEVDQKVFLGTDEIILDKELKLKDASFSNSKVGVSSGKISDLLNKLKALKEAKECTEVATSEKTPSEVKVNDAVAGGDNLGPLVMTQAGSEYMGKMDTLVSKLQDEVAFVPDDSLDLKLNNTEKVNLLGLVREWSQSKAVTKVEVKEEAEEPTPVRLDIYTRHKLSKSPCAPTWLKKPEALAAQLSPENIHLLFKCFAADCDFATDEGSKFVVHLESEHRGSRHEDPSSSQTGSWRCCVYCNLIYKSAAELTSHMIAIHGSCRYQCPHCYHRSGSQVALLVHQQALHRDEPQGFVPCRSIASEAVTAPVKVPPFRCQSSSDCRFSCGSASELSSHLRLRHGDPFAEHTEIVCWHCGGSFQKTSLLVLHSALMHSGEPVICGVRHVDLKQVKHVSEISARNLLKCT